VYSRYTKPAKQLLELAHLDDISEQPDWQTIDLGNLVTDEEGIAKKGLLIRHLILPFDLAGSRKTFRFIKEEMSSEVYVSLMGQYFPSFRASLDVSINRKITKEEYQLAKKSFFESGLTSGWMQEGENSQE